MQQPQAKIKQLVKILANKKIITPLLKFLRSIKVKRREEAKEKEVEWEQQNNQVGKDLLGQIQEHNTITQKL